MFEKVKPAGTKTDEEIVKLSTVLANVVFVLILIPIITIALDALGMQVIANPIKFVLNQVLAIVPNIFVAIILVLVGYYLAKLLGNLLINLLKGTGINNIYGLLNLKQEGQAVPFDLAKIFGTAVKVLVLLFFTVEALHLLHLNVLNTIGAAIISYLPFLVSGLLILIGGLMVDLHFPLV
ncbi:hypothetical protein SH601_07925 [Gracilibacillus sp. S3-1-1]|uniref:Uncharacterized protein n=1 Tax=Gracilibacillus pellucidus TaxID=3095368 RepID=A0ACC6M4S0_9BACI|nr:hypothetical protein [Gracilibacillus sp. S3-1-1]MDX8045919.1 hypothetical protein [Gracilibacillus sp. S3-1-1]